MNTTEMEVLPPVPKRKLKRIMSLRDLWDVHVELRGELAHGTRREWNVLGDKFCDFMKDKELEPMVMITFPRHLQSVTNASNLKINHMTARVKSFLKFIRRMRYISDDLWDALPMLKPEPQKIAATFTDEEYERVKQYCNGRNWCQPHLWLIILGYRTGMSLVDCCHLRWRDVHLNYNGPSFIDIHRIKTRRLGNKALCQIPIIAGTDVHIWLMKLKESEYLNYKRHDGITDFVHQDCPGLYSYASQKIGHDFNKIFQAAKCVPKKTFKNLRSTFCSNLINSGAQLALVCKMTGHSNITTLLKYLKADRRSMQEGLDAAFKFAEGENVVTRKEIGFET